jgi:hypothetical protein
VPHRRLPFSVGGTRVPHAPVGEMDDGHGKRTPAPVFIPQGKCVFWWSGCEGRPYLDTNMCWKHLYEARGWKKGRRKCPMPDCDEPANKLGGPCKRCYRRIYDQLHPEERRAIDRRYRESHREVIRKRHVASNRDYRARKKAEREAARAGV